MRCPYCDHESSNVVDTRSPEEGRVVRRRRQCPACQQRFTTFERAELQMPRVIKKDGSRIDFSREKLYASMDLALRKRPVATEVVIASLQRVEESLLRLGVREIDSAKIGDAVMSELKKIDQVAYVRFASVYRNFKDVEEFSETIQAIRPKRDTPKAN